MRKEKKTAVRWRKWTKRQWTRFILSVLIVAIFVPLTVMSSAGNILRRKNPDLALVFAHDEPMALNLLGNIQFFKSQSPASLTKVESLAKRSLRQQALNPVAIRLLGYTADVRGEIGVASSLMKLATRLTRRDFGAQLWKSEEAAASGNTALVLKHYDAMLRTEPESRTILFPRLTNMLADSDSRSRLVPYVRSAPVWLAGFLAEATGAAKSPADLVDLLRRSGSLPDTPAFNRLPGALLDQLAAKGEFPAFRQYYMSLPGSRAATFRSAGFNADTIDLRYPAAGWKLFSTASLGGSFSSGASAKQARLNAYAGAGDRGTVAEKMLFLPPGTHHFTATVEVDEPSADGEIIWSMLCGNAKQPMQIWTVSAPLERGRRVITSDFSIDISCAHQLLRLSAAGGTSQAGAEFIVDSVAITSR